MTSDLNHALEQIDAARRKGRTAALLFDYDGTLVPIVPHPSLAMLPSEARSVLERLAGLPRIALGFLSGRKLDDLKAMVGLRDVYYAGTGGLELDLRGTVLTPPEALSGRNVIEKLLQPLDEIIAFFHGAWLENKGLGIAVHYGAVAADLVPPLQREITQLLSPLRSRLRVKNGPIALEITPNLGWSKATALRMIVKHISPDAFPLFAGDADNDGDALEAAMSFGGLALWIGAEPSPITPLHLENPSRLVAFLSAIGMASRAP